MCCVHLVNCFKVLQIKLSAKCEPILDLRVSFSFLTLLNSFSCHFVLLALDLSVLFPPSDFLSAPSLSFTQSRSPPTVFLDLPLCLCLHLLFYLLCSIGHCVLFLIHSLPFWLFFFCSAWQDLCLFHGLSPPSPVLSGCRQALFGSILRNSPEKTYCNTDIFLISLKNICTYNFLKAIFLPLVSSTQMVLHTSEIQC